MADHGPAGVKYERVGDEYFQQRKLRRYAGVFSLWALGVGAVISGHFSGWNYGLGFGWGSMFVATILITLMYLGLTYSLAEMSPALPHTGGAYSFARSSMGPWGGFVTGVAENIEYVLTPAVVVFFIGSYLGAILETSPSFQPVYWILGYATFVAANLFGVELSFRVTVFVTLGALACLVFFYLNALPEIEFSRWAMNVGVGPDGALAELPNGGGPWFPDGVHGVLAALPFAVWLYLAIEQLPLAAEESYDPKADMPKGLIYGMATLMASALLITFLNSGIGSTDPDKMHGAFSLSTSAEPLLDGFRVIYGTGTAKLLAFLAVIGLIASFHTIIYAYGRQIYSLSRAGYYLPFMSVTHGKHRVPHMALYAGTVVGFVIMLVVWFVLGTEKGGALIGGTLLNMAVFGAMISYAMQGLSFIRLRQTMPDIRRPYRSPLGIPGAVVTVVVAVVTIYYQLQDQVYQKAVYGAAIWYALGMLYFAFVGRHKLVLSPEEEFALTRGEHGHPETEGYGTTKI